MRVLITGAARGLGAALVHQFAERGFDVIGTVRGDAPPEIAARCGRLLQLDLASTQSIDAAVAGYGLYALTKAAVTQLSQTLAVEAGPLGIRVNVIAPGATLTQFTERHLQNPDGTVNEERYDTFVSAMKDMSPIGEVGEALDQAWLVLYLASDASRFCTGQIWRANGGSTIPR